MSRQYCWTPTAGSSCGARLAEALYGYSAEEALGQYAARLLVREEHWFWVIKRFAEVMETG
ncbi:hypothetical protein [Streptomyces sp. NPDC003015]